MKVYTVGITRQAREHLREIKTYITNELLAPEAAKNTMAVLKSEIKSLSQMPEIALREERCWKGKVLRNPPGCA